MFPLKAAPDGDYLEARVGRLKFPAEMTAKVRFTRGGEEYRFDFTFAESSVDKSPAAVGHDVAVRSAGRRGRGAAAAR